MKWRKLSRVRFSCIGIGKYIAFMAVLLVMITAQVKVTYAQPQLGWVPFDTLSPAVRRSHTYMKDETTTGLLLNFDAPGMLISEVNVAGTVYHRLLIPGKAATTLVGSPEVPILGGVVEVPYGVDFDLEIVKSTYRTLTGYNVFPAQEPEVDNRRDERASFTIDDTVYRTDTFYPAELAWVQTEDIVVVRGHRIMFLKVNPVQYNPVKKELRVYSNIEVRINYSKPAQIERIDRRLISPAFEELLELSVLNYKKLDRFDWHDYYDGKVKVDLRAVDMDGYAAGGADSPAPEESDANGNTNGCDYLIITHGDFYTATDPNNAVVELRNWKRRKGLVTEVVVVADIPDSDANGTIDEHDIEDYIQDIYDTWAPPPTYILLVGDIGDNLGNTIIPTMYVNRHIRFHNRVETGTDLYYVTVDGTDYFPDIFIGRLSVDSAAQAADVIGKIIDYEENPPGNVNAAFYTDVSLVALFEDDDDLPPPDPEPEDGVEDRPWIENVEDIRQYLINNGYNAERIYNTSAVATDPEFYEIGDLPTGEGDLPNDLLVANGFLWNGGRFDIQNAIDPGPGNDGRFLVIFRDHGDRHEWSEPTFDRGDAAGLVNGELTPVVFSIACQTGWYDNESDDDVNLPAAEVTLDNDECFCEHFLRNPNGGTVAIIGATRNSYTGNNDFIMFGMCKAIWPDFDPDPPLSAAYPAIPQRESGPIPRMGQIHTFGKVFMANAYGHSDRRELHFDLYHLFGDPEMPIWTEEPEQLVVDHPDGVGSTGQQDFVVKVEDMAGNPVPSAMVSLTKDGEIISLRRADAGGTAKFTRNFDVGDVDITVTALNFRPYEGIIEVTASGAALNRLDPVHGPEGQDVLVGGINFLDDENVNIRLGDQLMLTDQADAGEFGQSGVEDVTITVPMGHAHGLFNVVAEGANSGRYAVDVFQVRDQNPVDLYTYSQWDNSTWHLHAGDNPTWNNPEIQLYDNANNAVQSNNLIVGNQYTIRATIYNSTAFMANNATVTFKFANYGAGQPVWYDIGTDQVDVPGNGSAVAEIPWAPASTGHTCVKVVIYHLEDIEADNNTGQENCHVGPTASPAEVPLTVWNTTENPAAVYFEVRQLYQNVPGRAGPLWKTAVRHPDPQVLSPDGESKADVIFDPDWTYIEPEKETEFAVTGFINGEMIGGVNMIITRRLRRWMASVHGGLALPLRAFADYYDPGFSVFADFGYNVNTRLSVIGLFGYNWFGAKDDATVALEDTYWINLSVNAEYRLVTFNRFSTYLRAGGGYYIPKEGDGKFGFNSGLVIQYHLSNLIALSVGADYHNVLEGMNVYEIDPPPSSDNIEFSVIHAGVVFSF